MSAFDSSSQATPVLVVARALPVPPVVVALNLTPARRGRQGTAKANCDYRQNYSV
jgi:hypothetical protein